MIDAALEILLHSKIIDSENDVVFNVTFGKNIVFQIRDEAKHRTLIVKASSSDSILRERHALETIEPHLVDRVPKLLAFEESGGSYVLVMEGVAHKRLTLERFEKNYHKVSTGLREIFQFDLSWERRKGNALEIIKDKLSQLPSSMARERINSYLASMDFSCVQKLPSIPQHCDFAFSNLGLRSDTRTLIVFDWEDYGTLDLPGFDIAVLITSYFNFETKEIYSFLAGEQSTSFSQLIGECLTISKIDREDFRNLYPVYLSLFLELKTSLEYDGSTVERVSKTLVKYIDLVNMNDRAQ